MHKQQLWRTTRYLFTSTTPSSEFIHGNLVLTILYNFQKQRAVVGDVAVAVKPATPARKAIHQKKVIVETKAEDIIVISPDTEEVEKVNKHLNRKKAIEGSSKKKGQTFTSTLTARSKVHIYN